MEIVNVEQGSEEWLELRCGVPSASNFKKIVTSNGEPSKQRDAYLYELAGEIISGEPYIGYKNDAMQMGNDREEEARSTYEFLTGLKVEQVGFCFFDENRLFGGSPDGLVGKDGGVEIKNAMPHVQITRLEKGWSNAEHYQQIQGNMYVTDRKWWDRVSYSRGIEPIIQRVERDEDFIKKLAIELKVFTKTLKTLVERYSI